ncbi:TolB-like 6-bladed beta-propeller domain-containing protein [Arenibacter algicola]|uniref:BF3164 family lipoprotein n=1 Tax=Arenibacter algicola TaxID=616991 RepID=UPI001C06A208|nr:BF3164 family lipoprotein [Arenibacter algicola]MBU2903430.1 TolB-like 6-bladed beta-propeller domain-containing protein [Arenibacter algicola]
MKTIFIYFIAILFFSCNKTSNVVRENAEIKFSDDDFKLSRKIYGEFVQKVNDSLLNPGTPYIIGDYLILRKKKSEKLFSVIRITDEEYLGDYMNTGRGPGEGLYAWRYFTSEEGNLGVYDVKLKKIVEFNLDSLLMKNEFLKEYQLPSYVLSSDGVFKSRNKIYFNNIYGNTSHFLYSADLDGNNLKGYGKLPMLDNRFLNLKLNLVDVFNVNMDNYNQIAAFSYSKIPLLKVFNLENKKLIDIAGPANYIPNAKDLSFRSKQFYKTIQVTEKYIYALYSGQDWIADSPLTQNAYTLYCFSHQGQLIEKLQIDKGIYTFSVYKDSIIYGLGKDIEGTSKLIKFEF